MKLKTRLEERDGQTVFVINRKEWMRGPQPGGDRVVLWDGESATGCCLGLAALMEGVSAKSLEGVASAASPLLRLPASFATAWTGWKDDLRAEVERANDADVRACVREAEVARIFGEARGWLVVFED